MLSLEVFTPTGKENGHEYVDLGLSVKWATWMLKILLGKIFIRISWEGSSGEIQSLTSLLN